jgi:predicted kinase
MPDLQPSAYLLCGPSLSGKSTVAAKLAQFLNAEVVCSDAINAERGLPFGAEGLPESVWAETLQIQLARMRSAALEGKSIVADDTLCYRWLRDRHRSEARIVGLHPVLLLLAPPAEILWARHREAVSASTRPVLSERRFHDHLMRFEWPAEDEEAIDVTPDAKLMSYLERGCGGSPNVV